MRRVVLLAILFFLFCGLAAQVQKDKLYHIYAGATIGSWGMLTTGNENLKPLYGVAWGIAAGAGKELIYDKWMRQGTCEFKDFTYTVVGSVISVGIITVFKGISKNREEKRGVYKGFVLISA